MLLDKVLCTAYPKFECSDLFCSNSGWCPFLRSLAVILHRQPCLGSFFWSLYNLNGAQGRYFSARQQFSSGWTFRAELWRPGSRSANTRIGSTYTWSFPGPLKSTHSWRRAAECCRIFSSCLGWDVGVCCYDGGGDSLRCYEEKWVCIQPMATLVLETLTFWSTNFVKN